MTSKTGLDRYTITFPWWQFWKHCPRCKGHTFIKSHIFMDDAAKKVYTCLGCGFVRPRKD